jgi:drug/metabolite transporter (DMT)-like permease
MSTSSVQKVSLPGLDPVGLFAVVGGALAMGVSPIFVRFASMSDVPAFASAFWRVALALPVLYAWALLEEKRAGKGPQPTFTRSSILAGFLFAGDLLLWHVAIMNTTIANATFFGTTTPIWTVLVAGLIFKEKIAASAYWGIALCIAGGAALVGQSMEINPAHVMGDLLGIGTAFFFGLYFFAVRAARLQAGAARVTFGLSLVTAPILGAAALLNGDQFLPSDGKGVAALLAMALVSHAGGQGLLAIALGRLPTVFTSLVIFIEAIGAALIAWLVLDESLGWLQALGGVLILGGIWISRPRERKERAE